MISRKFFYVFCAAMVALRLAGMGFWPLSGDEAYHWEWAHRIGWGYHDHPPLHSWVMYATVWLFGVNEFAVRLPSLLAVLIIVFLARHFANQVARQLGLSEVKSKNIGNDAGVLALVLPILTGFSVYATGDPWVNVCWLAGLYLLWRATVTNSWGAWLGLGVIMGLGIQAKFLFFLFGPLAVGWSLASAERRRLWLSLKPWTALVMTVLVVAPFIWWNYQHDWATFRFNFVSRHGERSWEPAGIPSYVGSLLAGGSPILLAAAVYATTQWFRSRTQSVLRAPVVSLLVASTVVPFVVFFWRSLRQEIGIHWPAVLFMGLLVLLPLWWHVDGRERWRRWSLWTAGVISTLPLLVLLPGSWILFSFTTPADADVEKPSSIGRLYGWPEMSAELLAMRDEMQADGRTVFLSGAQYGHIASLRFYADGLPRIYLFERPRPQGQQYRYWDDWSELTGQDTIFVTRKPRRIREALPRLQEGFARVDEPVQHDTIIDGRLVQRWWSIRAYDFNGQTPEWPDKK